MSTFLSRQATNRTLVRISYKRRHTCESRIKACLRVNDGCKRKISSKYTFRDMTRSRAAQSQAMYHTEVEIRIELTNRELKAILQAYFGS